MLRLAEAPPHPTFSPHAGRRSETPCAPLWAALRVQWEIARRLVCVVGALLLSAASAHAAEADFYAGKTLTIIAGLPPGGGVDGEMRVLAQYFSKYIPGHPLIVARNMPGAGGIVLGNYINSVAVPDGLTLAMPGRSGFLLSNVVPQKGIGYDLTKFSYVGGAGSAVNALWVSAKLGVASIADLKTRKPDDHHRGPHGAFRERHRAARARGV